MKALRRASLLLLVLSVLGGLADTVQAQTNGWGDSYSAEGPCFFTIADWVLLRRDHGEHIFLAEQQNALTGATQIEFTTGNTNTFDYTSGLRVGMGWIMDCNMSMEVTYLGMHNWTESSFFNNVGDPGTVALTSPYLLIGGITVPRYDVTYQSEFHTADLSLRWVLARCDTAVWSVLSGFRWIHIGESLGLRGAAIDPFTGDFLASEQTNVTVDNDLFGWQFGTELLLGGEYLGVSLFGKAGIYANRARARVANRLDTILTAPTDRLQLGLSETIPAGSVEAGVILNWRVSSHIILRGGYQVLFVTGLATAPGQLDSNREVFRRTILNPASALTDTFPTAQGRLNRDGFEFYHGPTVGVELTW